MSEKEEPVDLVAMVYQLHEENKRLRKALQRIVERTLRDAEGPELRCQNENNHKDALEALGGK